MEARYSLVSSRAMTIRWISLLSGFYYSQKKIKYFWLALRKNSPLDFETRPSPRSENFQGSIKSGSGGLIKPNCKRKRCNPQSHVIVVPGWDLRAEVLPPMNYGPTQHR
jgi:hypothetical protein